MADPTPNDLNYQRQTDAYIADLAQRKVRDDAFFEWQKQKGVEDSAAVQASRDRVARQDDERTAEIRRQADAVVALSATTPAAEYQDRLAALVLKLIEKRVTSTSVIVGAGLTSKTSAAALVADAKAILAEMAK